MNREILFRGKKEYDNSWEYGFLSWADSPRGRKYFINNNIVIEDTIGQFIGIIDKNGIKIFDGDILRFNTDRTRKDGGDKDVVVFKDCCYYPMHRQYYSHPVDGDWIELDDDGNYIFEIIGNINEC